MRLKGRDSIVQLESIERKDGRLISATIGSYDGDGNHYVTTTWDLVEYETDDGEPTWLVWYRRAEVSEHPMVRADCLRLELDMLDTLAEGEGEGHAS